MTQSPMQQQKVVVAELTALLGTDGADRAAALSRWLAAGPQTELHAWSAARTGKILALQDRRLSLRWHELSLQIGERIGRGDVLAWSAGSIVEMCQLWLPSQQLLPLMHDWVALPVAELGERQAARLAGTYAASLFASGKNAPALQQYAAARSLFERIGDKQGLGNAWSGEAEVLLRLGQRDAALLAYQKSRGLLEEIGDKLGLGSAWRGEAEVLLRLGQKDAALLAYQKSRGLLEEIGDKLGQGNAWFGEAEVLFKLGQNDAALLAFQQSRVLYEELGSKLGQGNAWRGEATVRFLLDQKEAALLAYQKSRAFYEEMSNKLGQGNAWLGEATVRFRLGQNPAALLAYQKSRALYEEIGAKLSQGTAWRGEAEVHFKLGQNSAALLAYQKSRALLEEIGDKLGQGNAWLGEAMVRFRLGQNSAARSAAQQAITLERADASVANQLLARTLLMQILLADRHESAALQEATALVALGEKWRGMGIGDVDRRLFAAQVTAPFDVLVPALARRVGAADQLQALVYAEAAHAPVMRDLLHTTGRLAGQTPRADLRRQLILVQRRLAELERRRLTAADQGSLDRGSTELELQLERLEFDALASLPGHFQTAPALGEPEIAALMSRVNPVLLYYAASSELIGFLLRPTPGQGTGYELTVRSIALSRAELVQRTETLRYQLANYGLFDTQSAALRRELGDQLLGPFLSELGSASQLIVVPHGPLHLLPLEALTPGGRPLALPVAITPSLAALRELAQRRLALGPEPDPPPLVALAAGQGLRGANPELDAITALFGQNWAGTRQGKTDIASYRVLAPAARHLLLISHAVLTADSRLATYLEVKADDAHAGRLTPLDIAEIPLAAELVTLSACDTARADAEASDERLDLARAFLLAGAASVLATRWKVPDSEETTRFLVYFYRGLRPGPGQPRLTKAQALHRAREQAIQDGLPAQIWAAWVLYGDGQ